MTPLGIGLVRTPMYRSIIQAYGIKLPILNKEISILCGEIEESEKAGSRQESYPGHPACAPVRCPGFDSWRLPAFSLLYFAT